MFQFNKSRALQAQENQEIQLRKGLVDILEKQNDEKIAAFREAFSPLRMLTLEYVEGVQGARVPAEDSKSESSDPQSTEDSIDQNRERRAKLHLQWQAVGEYLKAVEQGRSKLMEAQNALCNATTEPQARLRQLIRLGGSVPASQPEPQGKKGDAFWDHLWSFFLESNMVTKAHMRADLFASICDLETLLCWQMAPGLAPAAHCHRHEAIEFSHIKKMLLRPEPFDNTLWEHAIWDCVTQKRSTDAELVSQILDNDRDLKNRNPSSTTLYRQCCQGSAPASFGLEGVDQERIKRVARASKKEQALIDFLNLYKGFSAAKKDPTMKPDSFRAISTAFLKAQERYHAARDAEVSGIPQLIVRR